MRAVVFAGAEGNEVVALQDRPDPVPVARYAARGRVLATVRLEEVRGQVAKGRIVIVIVGAGAGDEAILSLRALIPRASAIASS